MSHSLRFLALNAQDARLAAAEVLDYHADELAMLRGDLEQRERCLRHEAALLREAVADDREAAEWQREADRELLPVRRRRRA